MSTSLVPDSERLAKLCFQTFESIPKTGKPILGKEWTVLSCIAKYEHQTNQMEIVSMGTGKKVNVKIHNINNIDDFPRQAHDVLAVVQCAQKVGN